MYTVLDNFRIIDLLQIFYLFAMLILILTFPDSFFLTLFDSWYR